MKEWLKKWKKKERDSHECDCVCAGAGGCSCDCAAVEEEEEIEAMDIWEGERQGRGGVEWSREWCSEKQRAINSMYSWKNAVCGGCGSTATPTCWLS